MQSSALIAPERWLVPGFPISLGNMGPRSGQQLDGTASCPVVPSAGPGPSQIHCSGSGSPTRRLTANR
jgi:hypothetical protein